MNFEITKDQEILRDHIRRFAKSELNEDIHGRDSRAEFPRGLWLKCGEIGLMGLPVDAAYGGSGLDPLSTAIALEALGYGCEDGGLTFSICAHLLACVVPIWKHGSPELKARLLPELCSGSQIATNAMTEPSGGSDAFAMATRAEPEADGFRITGQKIMCTNAPVADLVVTYAPTANRGGSHPQITAFALNAKTEGIGAGQTFSKMGLRTSLMGEVAFDHVFASGDDVIGVRGGGLAIFNQSMEWERACIAAVHVGTMERLLETTVAYARTRVVGGKPIGKNQAVSHKIADMKMRLETSRLLTYRTASLLDRKRSVGMDASLTKVYVSESLIKNAQDALQIFGGHGYLSETGVERILRDALGGTIYSGANEIQRNIVAAWLGL